MIRDVFGLIYAGQDNMNLRDLVEKRSVGALPVGGRYRAVDFVLSNMVNSHIRNIGIIAQRNYHSLMDHLSSGKDWGLNRKNDGLFILPPFDTNLNHGFYRGTCDAIRSSMGYISRATQQYCLLSGTSTIYNMVYDDMFEFHVNNAADITILYNVDKNFVAERAGYKEIRMATDESGRVTDIECSSEISQLNKIGMELYLIRKDLLIYLIDNAVSRGNYDFVEDVLIPNINKLKIMGYECKSYVGRIDSVASYFKLNMDMLDMDIQEDLFLSNKIYTKIKDEVPVKYGPEACVKNSLVANGCEIEGVVENCILFRGVKVGKGVTLKNSIVMQACSIGSGSSLEYVILDKSVVIQEGRRLTGYSSFPVIIRKGAVV